MDVKKRLLLFSFIVIVVGSSSYIFLNKSAKTYTKSIKGIQTQILSSSPTPTLSPSPTPTPTPTNQPLSTKIQPTPARQYGGWYWRPDLSRAQVWIGTDSAGKDIWIDHFPAPTPTPTQKPAIQYSSTQGAVSETSGFSSSVNAIQSLQTKVIEKK